MNVKNDIEQYSKWFNDRINFVSKIDDKDIVILVCCSLIDALARCVYCDKGNRERFIDILEQFGDTDIWTRVSIYHMVQDRSYESIKQNKIVADYCAKKLNWVVGDGKINYYDIDPTICTIKNEISNFESINELGEICQKYKYSTIFYKEYRCGLVHEARITSEFKFDYCNGDMPYYANYMDIDDRNHDKKHLVFPAKFIITATQTITNNVKEWLANQNINPYERCGLI